MVEMTLERYDQLIRAEAKLEIIEEAIAQGGYNSIAELRRYFGIEERSKE